MAVLLDQRDDGSLALYIDGDLQFDSRDERIYHEGLVLPALALAERRQTTPLRVLVCGGGDGLVARELLKSSWLAQVELVDYDPTVLELARTEVAALNEHSLDDPRLRVSVADAWDFVGAAVAAGRRYDLIIVDLTTPQSVEGARFQTIDWYDRLRTLLSVGGIAAINAASPSAQARAFWSIYNGLRVVGLQPRPYRVIVPSFSSHGYGNDWGFVLAAPQPITAAELDDQLPLVTPRQVIHDAEHLRRLFYFPLACAERRAGALPTRLGSDLLLYYLSADDRLDPTLTPERAWDGLGPLPDRVPVPPADAGEHLLPPNLQATLQRPIGDQLAEEALFQRVISLMPALQSHQTREMIAAFLASPDRFLASIDLRGLVQRLLRRARELPRPLVAELRRLNARLRRFAGDYPALLRMGLRIVTIVTVVVILANLLYPDSVYGKGSSSGPSGGGRAGDSVSLAQPGHSAYDPRGVTPSYATNGGYRQVAGQRGVAVDESGSLYPARRYVYFHSLHGRSGYSRHRGATVAPAQEQPVEEEAPYRLTADTDILADGRVVVTLTDSAYLMLSDEVSIVIDQKTGQPLLYLERDPAQVWRTAKEIERQQAGLKKSASAKQEWINWVSWLEFSHWRADDQRELAGLVETSQRLERARFLLGAVPTEPPPSLTAPVTGGIEVFSGVWLLPDASGVVIRQPDGISVLDRSSWFRDLQRRQPHPDPYPTAFKGVLLAYLGQQVKDQAATQARLQIDLTEERAELAERQRDRVEYDQIAQASGPNESVEYGTETLPVSEAQRRTNEAITRSQAIVNRLQEHLTRLPSEVEVARRIISNLGG